MDDAHGSSVCPHLIEILATVESGVALGFEVSGHRSLLGSSAPMLTAAVARYRIVDHVMIMHVLARQDR